MTSRKTAPPPAPRSKGGRKPKIIDEAKLKALAMIHCTQAEAASVLGMSLSTLKENFKRPAIREAWDRGMDEGKASLRRMQFRLAEKNATMAIFLGKQYLGQRDMLEHTGPAGAEIPVRFTGVATQQQPHAANRATPALES